MRILLAAVSAVLLACSLPGLASNQNLQTAQSKILYEAPQLTPSDKDAIKLARQMLRKFGDEVWPGFAQAKIAILIYNDAYEFVVGASGALDGWEQVANDDLEGSPYLRRRLTKPSSFATNLQGHWTGTMSSLPRMNRDAPDFLKLKQDQYAAMILHECFHAFQALRFRTRFDSALATYAAEKTYPFRDTAFADAWNKEGGALAAAVKNPSTASESVRQFLAIRSARRQAASFSPAMLNYEREIEWLEGLGKYAETRFYELAAKDVELSSGNSFQPTLLTWSDGMNLGTRLGQMSGDTRFYLSGNAQVRLLDRLAPGWKQRTLEQGVFLEDMLKQAIGAAPR